MTDVCSMAKGLPDVVTTSQGRHAHTDAYVHAYTNAYLQVTGVGGRMTDSDFTAEEETKFRNMVAQPDFAAKLYRSIGVSACLECVCK
jgi:hypothetical protein